jgi:hypothetical protein
LFGAVASGSPGVLAFELGEVFASFGRIFDRETIAGLMQADGVKGLKHSSLSRRLEWERLRMRDALRPDFRIYTGNDLAIDMVMYGSDYLLGLSTFAPEAFALRDRYWLTDDPRFSSSTIGSSTWAASPSALPRPPTATAPRSS